MPRRAPPWSDRQVRPPTKPGSFYGGAFAALEHASSQAASADSASAPRCVRHGRARGRRTARAPRACRPRSCIAQSLTEEGLKARLGTRFVLLGGAAWVSVPTSQIVVAEDTLTVLDHRQVDALIARVEEHVDEAILVHIDPQLDRDDGSVDTLDRPMREDHRHRVPKRRLEGVAIVRERHPRLPTARESHRAALAAPRSVLPTP